MNNNFVEVINKGVPISTPLTIVYSDLYEMSYNKQKFQETIDQYFEDFIKYLNQKIGRNEDIEIFKTLCILSDPITLEKKLHFAPGGFVSTLLFNLNVDNICVGYSPKNKGTVILQDFYNSFEEKLEKRVQSLRLTTTESKLKKAFPMLYEKYKIYENYYNNLLEIKKMLENPKIRPLEKLRIRSQIMGVYRSQGEEVDFDSLMEKASQFSIQTFCRNYANAFEAIMNNLDDIIAYLFEYSLDIDSLEIDNELLELYIANQSMETCESENLEDRQRFIYYVSDYFASDKSRRENDEIKITVGKVENSNIRMREENRQGRTVTPKSLYERYKKFLVENPDIKVIDMRNVDFSGMNLKEVEMFLFEYLKDLQANWEMIPEKELDREVVSTIQRDGMGMSEEEKQRHQDRLLELYIDKKEFFGSTDPFFRVRGKNTFDGYIGFLYTNGKVVLDKFYENAESGQVADGEAIYIMDISDFYRLSHYSKSTLMKDPKVTRVIHAGDWQGRVRKIIEQDNDRTNTADEVKELIKTNQLEEE